MKRMSFLVCLVIVALALPSHSPAATDWLIDLCPGVILINSGANAFSIEGPGKETISLVSSIPQVALGLAVEQPEGYFNFRVGYGQLLNSRLHSTIMLASAGFSYEVRPSIFMGPHITYATYSEPEWWGDGDAVFSDTSGMIFGFHLTMGDKVSYLFSFDYYDINFDVSPADNGWTPSDDKLDMSGLGLKFGFRAHF